MRFVGVTVFTLASLALTAPAQAQDVAVAEAHFNRGIAEMQAGRYDIGCPALAESYRLDPRAGRLFTLAECEAKWGRVARALAHYNDYLAMVARMTPAEQALQARRIKISTEQREALTPRVPQLTLKLPPNAPEGTVVRRDGVVLEQPSFGVALPVDPGEHVIITQAPGGPAAELRIEIALGERKDVELEVKPPASDTPASGSPAAAQAPQEAQPPSRPAASKHGSGQRTAAYVVGGVGVAGLVIGGITGALALSKSSAAQQNCTRQSGGISICNPYGKQQGDSAKSLGLVSTVAFSAGVVGVGVGVVLWLLEPRSPSRPASQAQASRAECFVLPQPGVVGVGGRWRF